MVAGPAQTVTFAVGPEISNIVLHTDDQQAQTVRRNSMLYAVGYIGYENGAATPKGNGHDCQHLGWIPKGTTFRIRQTNTALDRTLLSRCVMTIV